MLSRNATLLRSRAGRLSSSEAKAFSWSAAPAFGCVRWPGAAAANPLLPQQAHVGVVLYASLMRPRWRISQNRATIAQRGALTARDKIMLSLIDGRRASRAGAKLAQQANERRYALYNKRSFAA
jgi:hypothetical protein